MKLSYLRLGVVFLLIPVLLLETGCSSTPTKRSLDLKTSLVAASVPEVGEVHLKRKGQSIVSFERIERVRADVAVMVHGFNRDQSFVSSGYTIQIPKAAKGIPADDFSACFLNGGANPGLYKSKGKSNFCFFDVNKDGFYDQAMLDSMNNWGRFDIRPTKYEVRSALMGAENILMKKEIVYLGKGRFEYREYRGNGGASELVASYPVRAIERDNVLEVAVEGAVVNLLSEKQGEVQYRVINNFEE